MCRDIVSEKLGHEDFLELPEFVDPDTVDSEPPEFENHVPLTPRENLIVAPFVSSGSRDSGESNGQTFRTRGKNLSEKLYHKGPSSRQVSFQDADGNVSRGNVDGLPQGADGLEHRGHAVGDAEIVLREVEREIVPRRVS